MSLQGLELLNCFVHTAPFINELSFGDLAVAVADREKILCYVPGRNIDHKIKPGDPVKEGSVVGTAIATGKRVFRQVSKEVYGLPYIGIGLPIKDKGGQVVGAVSFNESIERQETLLAMVDNLFTSIREVTHSTETLSTQAEHLAGVGRQLFEMGDNLDGIVEETNGVIKVMQKITSQTNLLGLNASIEAARVGEKGKGFGVVADEIRKLSDNSTRSLKEIEVILDTLNRANEAMRREIKQIAEISSVQAAAVQEVMAAIQEVNALAQSLLQFAENLTK